MSAEIEICNLALAMIGADAIRSFDDGNKRARMCDVFFEPCRDYLLTKFDWTFARKFVKLQNDASATVPSGIYAYVIPADCLAPRDIHPLGSKDYWEIRGANIWCKLPTTMDVYLYYTAKVPDTTKFTKDFDMFLSTYIAVKIAPSITQSTSISTEVLKQYKLMVLETWESNANLGNDHVAYDDDPNNDTFVTPGGALETTTTASAAK